VFSPKGPAGALCEFINDINDPSAIRTALRQERAGKRRRSSRRRTPVKGLAKPGGP
jgi:hypothetical protein